MNPGMTPSSGPDWKSQLAGLHAPPPPSAWPPSGWVLLVSGLVLLGLVLLAVGLIRRWRSQAWKRQALRELNALAASADPAQLSTLMRRIARHRHGPSQAALGDADFAQFLSATSAEKIPAEIAQRLASCAHRPGITLEARDLEAARIWIRTC